MSENQTNFWRGCLWGVGLLALCALLGDAARSQHAGKVKKARVPSAEDQAKLEKLIKELFKEEYAEAAKAPAARLKLVDVLLQSARETTNAPPERYVLLQQAWQVAARGGDLNQAFSAIDALAEDFALDVLETRTRALELAGAAVVSNEAHAALTQTALDLLGEALAADAFVAAKGLAKVAEGAAQKSKDPTLIARAQQRSADVAQLEKEYARVQPCLAKLAKNAKDPAANFAAGNYRALIQGNWEKALPLLALGSDPVWKALAGRDLAQPKQTKEQVALGDEWWQLAEKEKGLAQLHLRQRAVFWYEEAAPQLSGPTLTRLEKRIAQVPPREPDIPEKVGEVRRLEGHTTAVWCVAFSADGRRALSGSVDGSIKVWDVRTGKAIRSLEGHQELVWSAVFAPDGRRIVSGSRDRTVRLWDVDSGKELKCFKGHTNEIRRVAISPDGHSALSGGYDGIMRLWNLATGKEVRQFPHHWLHVVAFSPDGKQVLSGSNDKTVRLWETTTGKEVLRFQGHSGSVWTAAFTPDGQQVLSGATGERLALWNANTGEEVRRLAGNNLWPDSLGVASDGRRAVANGGPIGTFALWDLRTGKVLHRFDGHNARVNSVAFSPRGNYALTGSSDKTVRLWRLPR
jgi:hypothetical protein